MLRVFTALIHDLSCLRVEGLAGLGLEGSKPAKPSTRNPQQNTPQNLNEVPIWDHFVLLDLLYIESSSKM